MIQSLSTSLFITVIGMGLVFASIVLFWWLMALLVRLTAIKDVQDSATDSKRSDIVADSDGARPSHRKLAALVAVATALASEAEQCPSQFPLPPTALVSTWQAVNRSRLLGQREVRR